MALKSFAGVTLETNRSEVGLSATIWPISLSIRCAVVAALAPPKMSAAPASRRMMFGGAGLWNQKPPLLPPDLSFPSRLLAIGSIP